MDAWEQWSALLVPHPNPHLFIGKKRLHRPSSSASRSSSMSSLSDGTQKRRKLTKIPRCSSPPKIEPLSFEHESDMTTNMFDFFPLHDTSGVNDCTTRDGNLMSQPKDHAQSTTTLLPHGIIASVPQSLSPTIVNPSSSFVALSMSQNATNTATGQLESDSVFLDKCSFPNPLGYITRKLTKRRHPTRFPKSASTPLIPAETTPPTDTSSSSTTVPDLTASKLTNPSCPPPISGAINEFHSPTGITDNLLASSPIPPQHAPQCTFESNRFQAENGDPISTLLPASNLANRIVHGPEISAYEANAELSPLQQECTGRHDHSVHLHKSELASILRAAITDVIPEPGLTAPEHIGERALSSKHFHPLGSSSNVKPLTLDEKERDVEAKRRSSHYEIPIAPGRNGDIDSEENSIQYHIDKKTENRGILPLPTLDPSALQQYPQSQDLHSNGWISVAPSLSTSPMVTTSSSQGHGWSSSASSGLTQDPAFSPSTSVKEEGIVGGNTAGVLMGTQELPLGAGGKPGLMSLAKWKWKSIRSKGEEETVANNKSDPGLNQVEIDLPTARGGGDSLCRGRSRSSKVNCDASQLIQSIPADNSSVTITQATTFIPLSGPIADPEKARNHPAETIVFAATKAQNDHEVYKSIKSKKPKFIIGDLDDSAFEFPVSNTSTEFHEPLEISNTATPRLRLGRRDAINNEGYQHGNRRWTLTSALTDEKISDAGLVKVLDRMRDDTIEQEDGGVGLVAVEKVILEGWGMPDAEGVERLKDIMDNTLDADSERGHTTLCESPTKEYGSYPLRTEVSPSSNVDAMDRGAHPKTMKQHSRSRSTPSQAWIAAQRALLTCRELILTERHYIAQLSALAQQDTATPPPPLMCDYAKELLQACERVLKGMEEDPSARGVARAFLETEEEVQGAYIRWCGVVGGWFAGGGDGSASVGRPSLDLTEVSNRVRQLSVKRRNRVGSKTDVDKSASPATGSEGEDGSLKRTVSTWRKSMPALSFETPGLYGGGDRKREKEIEREAVPPSARKPAVRELAILPTQRVMRYALIYQELLSHTPPTSPSRTFVERAAHAAARIAEKCDLAQGNSAFIASPSLNSNLGGSRTRNSSRTGVQRTPSRVPPLPMTLVATERLGYDTVPASPISIRSSVDSPSRCSTHFLQSTNTELIAGSRRLSVPFISIGWKKSNKQKIPAAESMQVHTPAGVSSLTYPA